MSSGGNPLACARHYPETCRVDNTTPPPAAAAPPRLWSLDVLRGICALAVFFNHWHLGSDFLPRGRLENFVHAFGQNCYDTFVVLVWPTGGNHPAVVGFFVLSGFCIHYPFERRARSGAVAPDWRDHYRRRFWRIMPVYWIAALLGLVVVGAELLRPSGHALLTQHTASSPIDIVVRLTGLYGLYPREIFAGNVTLNTVAMEMVIYAAYPWFHHLAMRGGWLRLGAVCAGLQLVGLVLLRFITPFWVFNSVFMMGIFWYAGALAAHLYVTRGTVVRGRWVLLVWLAFLALKAFPHFYGLNLLKQNLWGFVCTLGMLWGLHQENRQPQWRVRPVFVALRYSGQISYSLYAVHTPAMLLATWALVVAGRESYPLQLAATLVATAAMTLAVHYGIENVFYRPRPAAGAPTAANRRTSLPA